MHLDTADVWRQATVDTIAALDVRDIRTVTDGAIIDEKGTFGADLYEKREVGHNKRYRQLAPIGTAGTPFEVLLSRKYQALNLA